MEDILQGKDDQTSAAYDMLPSELSQGTCHLTFKRRRRNMFDVKPEEMGIEDLKFEPTYCDQVVDNESGELIIGPGCGGFPTRFSEAKKALPKLLREQEEKLAMAKRFAMEQSVQFVLAKQKVVPQTDSTTLHSSAQRQRALALMCRTYIGSINFNLDEDAVRASFLPFGPIKMIDLSRDATTGRHKGFAFVEYELPEAAQLALEQMNNVLMGGRNIKVGRPSNVPQAAPWIEQILEEARQYARIYVSSIHPDLTEQDIKSVFEAFGTILNCKLAPDQMTGKHKGYGFIEYSSQDSANSAILAMNLFDLGGQYIRVGRAITPPSNSEKNAPPPAASVLVANVITASIKGQEAVATHGATALIKPTKQITPAGESVCNTSVISSIKELNENNFAHGNCEGHSASLSRNQTISQNQFVPEGKLKKTELLHYKIIGELNLEREEKLQISGKDDRYMMMQKLNRKSRSGVVVLRNMVSGNEIDEDLQEEVNDECSRFGEVAKVIILEEKRGDRKSVV